MSKQVKDFTEGEHLTVNLLVNSVVKGTTNSGAPYLSMVLQDSSKSIEAKLWDVKPEVEKEIAAGKVVQFEMEIIKYRNNLQAKVMKVFPVLQSEVNQEDFVFRSPISKDSLRSCVASGIAQIQNENISKIVNRILNYYDEKFFEYPAASKIHHNFIGGLATHSTGMLKIALAVCDLYPEISRDYMIAGTIIHDLGKIEELSSPVVTEYTTAGKLLGHISILDARLLQIGQELGLEESEELLILRHMVLSHHGELEFGSPVRPEIMEAELLSMIDNMDAKINIVSKALSEVNKGDFSPKIFALENRSFYKHK